jgi:hypothetical protein
MWSLVDDHFASPPTSLTPGATTTVPSVGYAASQVLSFRLPGSIRPGPYRLCKKLVLRKQEPVRVCGEFRVG